MDTITQSPPRMHVDLHMSSDDYAQLSRETGAVEVAQTFQIDCQDMAIAANDELKSVKARIVRIKEMKKGFVSPARAIIAQAEAIFDPALNALEGAEKFLKTSLLTWNEEQERIAAEARRKAEEDARKARQDAERKAAEEQARAEEKARAEREAAAKAEEERRKAEAEGNTRAAAAAAAQVAAAKAREASVLENAQAKATETIMAAAASAPVIAPPPEKLAGLSFRANWAAELKPGTTELQAVIEIAGEIVAGRRDLAALLKLDMSAADKLAKAFKESFNVPCLVAKNTPVASSRK